MAGVGWNPETLAFSKLENGTRAFSKASFTTMKEPIELLEPIRWYIIFIQNVISRSHTGIREFTQYECTDAVLEARLKRVVGEMRNHGANSMFFKVIIGDRAGEYEIYNWYETVGAGARAMKGFMMTQK
jgi:hypothetical protein